MPKIVHKNVGWDADYYNSLSEDDCIICLTERQVYLIGIVVGVIQWVTRWTGNVTGMDLDEIASELEYRIAERMTCQNLTQVLNRVIALEQQINITQKQIDAANGGDPLPTPETTYDDVINTPDKVAETTWSRETCDIPDKDAIFNGMRELVGYINQTNIDALQNIAQAGNAADQAQRLISGVPVLGQLPIDEIVDYAAFIANELLDEYEATVDEALLEQVTCDLFCLATSNNCSISMRDVLDYFANKVGGDFFDLIGDLANVVQFALTGTFSGDQYFYFMSFFQLLAASVTEGFFGFRPISYYSIRVETGMNNPDNDWELLCVECPTYYRIETHDFRSDGLGEWTLGDFGVLTAQGIEGENQSGSATAAEYKRLIDPSWRIVGSRVWYDRQATPTPGGNVVFRYRPTPDSPTGAIQATTHDCSTIDQECACTNEFTSPFYLTGMQQYDNFVSMSSSDPNRKLYVQRVSYLYELGYAPDGSRITTLDNWC